MESSLSESAVTPSRSPPPRSNSARSVSSSRDSFNDDRLDLKGGTALVALGHPRQLDLKFKRGQVAPHEADAEHVARRAAAAAAAA